MFVLLFLKGPMQVFLPPEGLPKFGEASPTQDTVFCAQLQRFQIKNMNERGLHSWHAENCHKKFPFLCKRSTCLQRRQLGSNLVTWQLPCLGSRGEKK